MNNTQTNIITGAFEAVAFAILIAAFVAVWFVTPAHACTETGLIYCDQSGAHYRYSQNSGD